MRINYVDYTVEVVQGLGGPHAVLFGTDLYVVDLGNDAANNDHAQLFLESIQKERDEL